MMIPYSLVLTTTWVGWLLLYWALAPELTQTAYRVGDSVTNIVTPLMPYFPLIVVYCQRYVRGAGIGTVLSMMIPYSLVLTTTWVGWLLLYWALGLPLGLGGAYHYP
jgi:aminobenzoyl-glutamate transport protein